MPESTSAAQFTWREMHKIARERLEISTVRCICGWFDHEYTGDNCPRCKRSIALLTQWWREMDDRFLGMSREELQEDFETWSVLSAEIVQ